MLIQLIKPCDKISVDIFDWIPQRVDDAYTEMLVGSMSVKIESEDDIVDQVVKDLMGDEFFAKFKLSVGDERKEMLKKYRIKKARQDTDMEVTLSQQTKAQRVKVRLMVKSIKDGDVTITDSTEIEKRLMDLPRECYKQIEDAVSKIEGIDEEEGKKE